MADYNSNLPVIGSVYVSNPADVGGYAGSETYVKAGSVVVENTLDVLGSVYVSNAVDVGGYAGSETYVKAGSVVVENTIDVLGSVYVSNAAEMGGSETYVKAGSVIITNTVLTTGGVRTAIINDYNTSADVAAAGNDEHSYLSVGSFYVSKILAGFSGKGKIVVSLSGTSLLPKATGFNSTATPNINLDFGENNGLYCGNGSRVVVTRYNRESTSAQDVYSTIIGYNN